MSNVSHGRSLNLIKSDKLRGVSSWHNCPFVWKKSGIQWNISLPLKIDPKILYNKHSYSYQLRQPMKIRNITWQHMIDVDKIKVNCQMKDIWRKKQVSRNGEELIRWRIWVEFLTRRQRDWTSYHCRWKRWLIGEPKLKRECLRFGEEE